MESAKEPISVRVAQLNSQLVSTKSPDKKSNLLSREGLLDALNVLYEECKSDCLKNSDKHIASFINKQQTVLRELKSIRVNTGDFELKKVIGRGYFGEVHLVKEKQTNDVYAMKIVKKSDCLLDKHASYEEERNIMASGNSFWITNLQYAFQDTNYLYYVMEYHPGGDLSGLLQRQGGTIPESAARFYISELILALHDLHTMGYVHRDIKPDNILVDYCGHIKLADFGSAAKLNSKGLVCEGMPVGTPDYIAPEVLQCMNNKSKMTPYGISCDYWSVGIIAYQLTVGNLPFASSNTTGTYSKIMNFKLNLKFPPEIILSQAYITLIKGFLTESSYRLNYEEILKHPLFINVDFNTLKDQVPPYVPKINSVDDTSNFGNLPPKKNQPNIDNFKSKTKFSGKNLPFVGFTYVHSLYEYKRAYQSHDIPMSQQLLGLEKEISNLQTRLHKADDSLRDTESLSKKLEEKTLKIETLENLRNNLERDLANNIAECSSLKRTLELERKDRTDLERKALELIKSAKLKWENSEKTKVNALNLEIAQEKEKVTQLTATNSLLKEQLDHALQMENKHKTSLGNVEHLKRQSIVGLESHLERVTSEAKQKITNLQKQVVQQADKRASLQKQIISLENSEVSLTEKLKLSEENCNGFLIKLEANQKLIRELENKITMLEESNRTMEQHKTQICLLQEELVVVKNNQKVEDLEEKLEKEKTAYSRLKEQFKKLKEDFNASLASHEGSIEVEKTNSELKIKQIQDRLLKVLEEKNTLESNLEQARLSELNNRLKVQTLEDLVKRLECGVSKLESDCDKENVLKEQIERLEQQLIQIHENAAVEKEEHSKLKTKFWRLEKDLSNAEIDKRIFKREIKEIEDQNKQLMSQIEEHKAAMTENNKKHEEAVTELSNLNENLGDEIMKLQNIVKQLEFKLESERSKCDDEKTIINQLKGTIDNCQSTISDLNRTLEAVKEENASLSNTIELLTSEKSNLTKTIEDIIRERDVLYNALENCKGELKNAKVNSEALKEACIMLENQLIEYEQLHATYENKQRAMNNNIDKLIHDLTNAREEIQKSKKAVNEQISLKLMAESKSKRLKDEIDCLKRECDTYKVQSKDFREYSTKLNDELGVVEEKMTNYEVSMKTNERQISDLLNENTMLKEENSEQKTHLQTLKESNYKTGKELADVRKANSLLIENINELQETLTQKDNYFKERELKADGTIVQQTKLIDFLQSKMEEGKKKKTLTDKLFGSSKKENHTPIAVTLSYRDLENLLSSEREINKNLRDELSRFKSASINKHNAEIKQTIESQQARGTPLSSRAKVVENHVRSSNGVKQSPTSAQKNRPNELHRFETKMCTKSLKCFQCSNQIILGRNMKYCTECDISLHMYCLKYLTKPCAAIQEKFARTSSKSLNPAKNEAAVHDSDVLIEGWIKIPVRGNTTWDRHYASLTSSALNIYAQPPNNSNVTPIKSLDLNPPNNYGCVIAEPPISEVCCPITPNDLPFVIKLDVNANTTCWPSKSIIFMTLNKEDKQKWRNALESTFKKSDGKYNGEQIMRIPDDLEINCCVELNSDTKLFGTDQGLHSLYNNQFLRIAGPTHVYQIRLLPTIKLVLMIADVNRYIIGSYAKHIANLTQCSPCSSPTLMFKTLNVLNMNGFHLFEASDFVNTFIVVAATAKQIVILVYEQTTGDFKCIRSLDTAEPTSCFLFTEHSLIVGANKFFEIDLITLEADEYLDASDPKLHQAIMCYKMRSFPMAVMRVSKDPIEYLLCFHEFGIFVDEFGRCSRSTEMKWNRLPFAFFFYAPYLYIVHFSRVEVIKVTSSTCVMSDSVESLLNVDSFNITLNNPKYLGHGKKGIYVSTQGMVKYLLAESIDPDSVSLSTETSEEGNGSPLENGEFSFTSSLVNTLDDSTEMDSDNLETNSALKKVTFNAHTTDL